MQKEELIEKYVSGNLTPEEEKQLLQTIADDAELRTLLRFEFKLRNAFSEESQNVEWESSPVPDGFTEAVMKEISFREESSTVTLGEQLKTIPEILSRSLTGQWRPVYTFAMGIVLTLITVYPWINTGSQELSPQLIEMTNDNASFQEVSATEEEVVLRFVFIDDEESGSVAVAGDFSNWEPIELSRQTVNGENVWTGLVSMTRGEHNYMFVKDGEWITDPLATVQRDDGFGNQNAVVYL